MDSAANAVSRTPRRERPVSKTLVRLALLPVLALGLIALWLVLRVDELEDGADKARKAGT